LQFGRVASDCAAFWYRARVTTTKRKYFRAMKSGATGGPRCGDTGATLGVRPRDVKLEGNLVRPSTGGMSVTPDDPAYLPEEFRPDSLGGIGRLPVFEISEDAFGETLSVRPDPKRPTRHAFVEPRLPTSLQEYQRSLCATSSQWRPIA
jgi:hypothetical protein